MTKDVCVVIEGLELNSIKAVIRKATGTYYKQKDRHCIRYKELYETQEKVTHHTLYISKDQVVLKKTGPLASQMVFDIHHITRCDYPTSFGNIVLNIRTSHIQIDEQKEVINVQMRYDLLVEEEIIFSNKITISIQSCPKETLSLER